MQHALFGQARTCIQLSLCWHLADGDTGYGNAMNVRRTVKGYAAAGFAGVLIEDQVGPFLVAS